MCVKVATVNTLELVIPVLGWKEEILEYWREFEAQGDSMDGTAGLGAMLKNSQTVED